MKTQHKARKIILSIAIVVIFLIFVAYAIETFYPSPKRADCEYNYYETQEDCEANSGKWTAYPERAPAKPIEDESGEVVLENGYCVEQCQTEYETSTEKYNRNVFFISLILGLITIIIAVLLSIESVSAGFMAGGVLLVIYGTIRYWGSLSDVLRTLMLGLALAVLVWIGYKKLK